MQDNALVRAALGGHVRLKAKVRHQERGQEDMMRRSGVKGTLVVHHGS